MTTLAQVLGGAPASNGHAHPDMQVLGPATWAELHAWADRFAAKVGDSCGCGKYAQDAAKALHDSVNVHLRKPAKYPENLAAVASIYQAAAHGVMVKEERMQPALFQPKSETGIYPWPDGMFDDEEEEEDDDTKSKRKAPRLSQSFLDTILHTAIGTGVAIGVSKALNPPPAPPPTLTIIKEEEAKPQEPTLTVIKEAVPAVASPKFVEGDQAQVDLGTLLEEIDQILKNPDKMGVVDANKLVVIRT